MEGRAVDRAGPFLEKKAGGEGLWQAKDGSGRDGSGRDGRGGGKGARIKKAPRNRLVVQEWAQASPDAG